MTEYSLTLFTGGIIEIGNPNFSDLDLSKYSYVQMTPSLLSVKVKDIIFNNPEIILHVGGEAITIIGDLLKYLLEKDKVKALINVYGPTETTVYSLNNKNTSNNFNTFIGRPIANTSVYVLDEQLRPLPVGAIGELYIGGDGVARGYLNNEQLTNERFLINPFQTELEKQTGVNDRIYKTGDLVRYMPDGNIEYIGRNDFQVKIRGFRIELGEIEAAITACQGISRAVVIDKEQASGNKYLAAYYVGDGSISEDGIRETLQASLPDYMIPAVFIKLDTFPLTVNGKLDRRALPEPDFVDKDNFVAPQNELQRTLCKIFADVLGLETDKMGIDHDFFRMGGNSIMAIKLATKLTAGLDREIQIATIFKHKTVREIEKVLPQLDTKEIVITKSPVKNEEDQILSFAQERLWFIDSYEGGSNAYNIPMALQLKDTTDPLILIDAIRETINRHEVLRTLIKTNKQGQGYQCVLDQTEKEYDIETLDIDEQQVELLIQQEAAHIFNLEKDYPIRVRLLRTPNHSLLSIVVHHIAFDGWSTEVLVKDLAQQYDCIKNKKAKPEPLEIQYKDFAQWQRNFLSGDNLNEQLNFWISKLDGYENLNLPADFVRPVDFDYKGKDIIFELDEKLSDELRKLAREKGVSLYSVLLSGYYLMLSCFSGQKDIVVGSPIANRHYTQTQDLIGFFVNSVALRQQIDPQMTVSELIRSVAESIEQAQGYQDLPFEKLVDELKVEKDSSRNPVFQAMFGIQSFVTDKNLVEDITNLFETSLSGTNDYNSAKFDIILMIQDGTKGKLAGEWKYAASIYKEDTVRAYSNVYITILSQLSFHLQNNNQIKLIEYISIPKIDSNLSESNNIENLWADYEIEE